MRYLGVDLAWSDSARAYETGVAALEDDGRVSAAGWTVGVTKTIAWLEKHAGREALAFVDAPLLVLNQPRTQRLCEKEVGRSYGRWKVSANSTNLGSRHLAGVALRRELEAQGWIYDDGLGDSSLEGSRVVSECYPYTTLVGARELGYDQERPLYKRKPRRLPAAEWRPIRAAACEAIVAASSTFASGGPRWLPASAPSPSGVSPGRSGCDRPGARAAVAALEAARQS